MSKRFSLTAALLLDSALVGPASAQPTDPDARAAATLAHGIPANAEADGSLGVANMAGGRPADVYSRRTTK